MYQSDRKRAAGGQLPASMGYGEIVCGEGVYPQPPVCKLIGGQDACALPSSISNYFYATLGGVSDRSPYLQRKTDIQEY